MQGSYELKLSQWLDERGIKWKREGCFRYDGRRYFPDFHLVETDEYLDIKNDYLIGIDADKIKRVREQNPSVKLHVFTLKNMETALTHLL